MLAAAGAAVVTAAPTGHLSESLTGKVSPATTVVCKSLCGKGAAGAAQALHPSHGRDQGADLNNKIIAATAIALIGLGSYAAWANVPGNAKGASQAGQQTHTTSVGGLELPQYIGPLEFIGETGGTDPRISATYSYRAMGLALDIHVSDLGADILT